ncbi:hypothetical protein L915_08951 [Phytophthora nicotianae]|uniref:Uncharacterized protein n=1 Tax=Phytophthora nicotianae TaxID=4792 RepID=W2GVX1_PHYNI|nr:hypothetical protein L915_08951 [Phytophthora nicotianae]
MHEHVPCRCADGSMDAVLGAAGAGCCAIQASFAFQES